MLLHEVLLCCSDGPVVFTRNQLKAAVSMLSESSSDLLEDLGLQASSQGGVVSAEQLCQTIDGISGADVLTVSDTLIAETSLYH